MLQHYSTTLSTYSNRYQVTDENQPIYTTQYGPSMDNNGDRYCSAQRPTSHVAPLLSSVLCSSNYNFSIFSGDDDLSMASSSNEKYNVEQSLPQTLTADELLAITTRPASCRSRPLTDQANKHSSRTRRNKKKNGTASLVDLGRRLRTNLSLAKQRMMTDLKQSREPSDLAMYTRLENISLEDSASTPPSTKPRVVTSGIVNSTVGNGNNLFRQSALHSINCSRTTPKAHGNKYRVHKKKPYNSGSSYMELQTNPNGYVSVVLRKSTTSTTKDSYSTLTRSFSFNVQDDAEEASDSEESDDGEPLVKDTMMKEAVDHSVTDDSWPIMPGDGMMLDAVSPTWMQDLEFILQQQQQQQQVCHDGLGQSGTEVWNESNIDSWLQRGGLGCSPMVAATDQELADLLDFD